MPQARRRRSTNDAQTTHCGRGVYFARVRTREAPSTLAGCSLQETSRAMMRGRKLRRKKKSRGGSPHGQDVVAEDADCPARVREAEVPQALEALQRRVMCRTTFNAQAFEALQGSFRSSAGYEAQCEPPSRRTQRRPCAAPPIANPDATQTTST
jgi:hypothetical protein